MQYRNNYGIGRGGGLGYGRGRGFSFRGMSPPWPYIGRGRGGLPRCGYFTSTTSVAESSLAYRTPFWQITQTQELDSLKREAEWLRSQLEQVQKRIHDLEADKAS